ncbi:hypothetical protein TraAM80_01510 [Trypanosoma rangeli]|uniref:Uncharacterized protein n=1 Tax=Trypanosoma rangeli TaxID=5698 RepID=A0A422NYF9_TRYRA|nr:uncharacterized protein TraAM80_01510 [Trypanosoma rangeli]RNF10464.1 hypothetical protein TraAM80_01510 [Trypanosoma rangeli]|eukprot:RNF10464.1 hypothetical protein TraAM80_01510 [Trypanosoma rangeli]
MVCCCSRRFLSSRAVPQHKLRALLCSCGLQDIVEAYGDNFAREVASRPQYQLFIPLFTPYFTIEGHHLTMLGDTLIDDFLSQTMLRYAVHAGLVLTTNATRQLNAVLHNHFTLRLFAKELHFDELAVPLSLEAFAADDDEGSETGNRLAFLEPKHVGLREHDVAGTSFHVTPLRSGQSPLGWMFSHFIGALQQAFGAAVVPRVLSRVYGDVDVNLPGGAAALLLRTLQHFPAGNVTEAVVAAQGLPLRFVTKTRVLPDEAMAEEAHVDNTVSAGMRRTAEEEVVCSGFGVHDATLDAITLDGLASNFNELVSLASGPGGIDAVNTWRQRAQREIQEGQKTLRDVIQGERDDGTEDYGWLQPREQERYRRGAAFYNAVNFSAVATYFADAYGPPQPVNGQRVTRLKFMNAVRDPLFYDTRSDMRNGVPFSTDGEPLAQYLDRFNRPHRRLFEVALVVGSGEGRTAGRAIATRYTVARESACLAYLGAVLHDLHTMKESNSTAV